MLLTYFDGFNITIPMGKTYPIFKEIRIRIRVHENESRHSDHRIPTLSFYSDTNIVRQLFNYIFYPIYILRVQIDSREKKETL